MTGRSSTNSASSGKILQDDRAAEMVTRRQIEEEKKENEAKLQKDQIKMKFDSAAAELTSSIDSFVRVNSILSDSLGDASISFKQKEWEKIELEFDSLKKRFVMVRGIGVRRTRSKE